jgi:Amino acid permease
VEAIANGVPLFKQPRVARAKQTGLILGGILGARLLGLAVLADRWQIGPRSGQTVLSQIMATAIGRHWAYYVMSLTITLVLTLAANTSFGAMPLLASLLARDNYLPHRFALRDDRQVFAAGIWTLAHHVRRPAYRRDRQPHRRRPHHGAADPHRHRRGPRRNAAAAPRRPSRPGRVNPNWAGAVTCPQSPAGAARGSR